MSYAKLTIEKEQIKDLVALYATTGQDKNRFRIHVEKHDLLSYEATFKLMHDSGHYALVTLNAEQVANIIDEMPQFADDDMNIDLSIPCPEYQYFKGFLFTNQDQDYFDVMDHILHTLVNWARKFARKQDRGQVSALVAAYHQILISSQQAFA